MSAAHTSLEFRKRMRLEIDISESSDTEGFESWNGVGIARETF